MPKARLGVGASVKFDPVQFAEPDWEAVEIATRKEFSSEARAEIKRALVVSRLRQALQEQQPPISEVEALRVRLRTAALELLALGDRFRPDGGMGSADEADEALFMALALSVKDTSFSLTNSLNMLRPICSEIARALVPDELSYNLSSNMPATMGLAYFIGEAVKGATRRAARANPGYQAINPRAVEYRRWGLHLSAKAGDLSKLMSKLTGGPVSRAQVQAAWLEAKRLGLLPSQE